MFTHITIFRDVCLRIITYLVIRPEQVNVNPASEVRGLHLRCRIRLFILATMTAAKLRNLESNSMTVNHFVRTRQLKLVFRAVTQLDRTL